MAYGSVNVPGKLTAEQVGAAAKNHTHTAEQVGAVTKQYVDSLFRFCVLGPVAQVEVECNGSKRTANVAMKESGYGGLCYSIEYKFTLTDAATVRIIPPTGFRFSALNESFIPSIRYKYGNTYTATLTSDGWFEFYVGMRDAGECEIYNASNTSGSFVMLELA